jgi:hypothetical protein
MLRPMNRRLALLMVLVVAFAAGTFIHAPRARAQSSGTTPGGTCTTCTTKVASGSTALHTALIATTACDTTSATATGALTTDQIIPTFNADVTAVTGYAPLTTGALTIYIFLTAGNVNFRVCNPTAGSITPGAVTLNWQVTR